MNEVDAGGRNTQKQPSRAENLLESGLSDAANGIADLVAQARAVDAAADEYGHARSRAYTDAVALLKATAKVGHTIAELRGSKFEHNINVRRQESASKSPADEEEEQSPWMWLGGDTLFNWKSRQAYKLEKPRPEAISAGRGSEVAAEDTALPISEGPYRNEEDTPLAISQGSNGNSEEGTHPPISEGSGGNFDCSGGEPRVRSL